jgi:ribosomal protein S18 acetylase RimI-like enzyme
MKLIPNDLKNIQNMHQQSDKFEFVYCNYNNTIHREKLVEILNCYIKDPMGGGELLDINRGQKLIAGLSAHPASFVLFILYNSYFAGLATCFINFSTFKIKPYINLHDFIIKNEFRGLGLGQVLLDKVISIASERGYCKVTLEVRADNTAAKTLYQKTGFKETEPAMHFWTKEI